MRPLTNKQKIKSFIWVSLTGVATFTGLCVYNRDKKFYKNVVMPCLRLFDAENAHKLGVLVSKYRIFGTSSFKDPESLKIKAFGIEFPNPVGIAAGFDKNGEAILGLKDLGFGFVEIGSVTPLPQPGNAKPRVFRLSSDAAIINRYGFNSDGHDAVLERLKQLRASGTHPIIGVNLGKNKTSNDPINDYIVGIEKLGPCADYLVINISSPNTAGLRDLQRKKEIKVLLTALVAARNNLPATHRPPLLLKLAPDLNYAERKDIAEVIQHKDCKIDGLIISNTTIQRPNDLQSTKHISESGGLSGKPLRDISTQMIADMYKLTNGVPIIGVGGVDSGDSAYEKIQAGASVVQLYTALVYEGPTLVEEIKQELTQLLEKDGHRSIAEAVGKKVKS